MILLRAAQLLVDFLLGDTLVVLNVAGCLLRLVTGEGTDDRVFLSLYTVEGTFGVTLSLGGLYRDAIRV